MDAPFLFVADDGEKYMANQHKNQMFSTKNVYMKTKPEKWARANGQNRLFVIKKEKITR